MSGKEVKKNNWFNKKIEEVEKDLNSNLDLLITSKALDRWEIEGFLCE